MGEGKVVEMCFGAAASSAHTNNVDGIPNQLPSGAGTASVMLYWYSPFAETDFQLEANLHVDSSIAKNKEVIGVHLHTGSATTNGPVNLVFCGGPPLPGPLLLGGLCKEFLKM